MRPFNLEDYLKNPSRKIVTRGGSKVKIHCTNFMGVNPVIAEIEGSGESRSFGIDGRYFSNDTSVRDLFFAPEKHEGWVNLYRSLDGKPQCGVIFDSEVEAKSNGSDALATIKIEWEE